MALDAFCKIDGIPGESTDDKHADWIELLSFNHGVHQPASATASSSGGGTAERCEHQDYTITKFVDKSSPKLYEYCSSGKHIKEVTLEYCRAAGDDKVKYLEIKLEEVIISNVNPGGDKNTRDLPTESISFNYGKIKWTYTQQKRADGSGSGNVAGGWDLTKNKVHA